jgi:hypothetical protein
MNLVSDIIEHSSEEQRLLLDDPFAVAWESDLWVGMLACKVRIRP